MTATITCTRCQHQADAMPEPPMPTPMGREVHAHVCRSCWQAWLRTQVILINEYRLNLVDPEARRQLETQMRAFLALPRSAAS